MTTGGAESGAGAQAPRDRLEELVFEALERQAAGGPEALEGFLADHPRERTAVRAELERLGRMGLLAGPQEAGRSDFPERLGDFRLIEKLGEGGMGVVYLAEQVSLSRRVALKLVRPEHCFFPGARERFRREVEAVARLQHPGIVPVYSVGEESGVPYFAMERLDGCTLLDALRLLRGRDPSTLAGADLARAVEQASPPAAGDESALRGAAFEGSWTDACLQLARQVAEALEHAHSRGIVHRDVKPSNIALTRSGRARLFDFGLALAQGEDLRLTRTGSQAGSLPYMSPEQVAGERELDARTDVWSLGVTLYELLTLAQPFEDASSERTRASILAGDFARPRAVNRRLPGDVETVVLAALEHDRVRRYASAGDLARDLGNLLARRPVEARRAGVALRLVRWSQRHPRQSAAVLASIPLALVALAGLAWIQTGRSRTERELREQAEASASEARDSAMLADRRAREAEAERAKVLRLADLRRVRQLELRAAELFPSRPERIDDLDAWLRDAELLRQRLPEHRAALAQLQREADAATGSAREELLWQVDTTRELLAALDAVFEPERGLVRDVERRLDFASQVEERTLNGPEAAEAWARARASIADPDACPAYGGLDLAAQVGLLPLGRDPDSGLWEFAHVQSGEVPGRDGDGRLILTDDSAIVLVLLPGGTFRMGAQSGDPSAPNYDPQAAPDEGPVHAVTLDPFFLSKYEMTQGQWLRATGTNPSASAPSGQLYDGKPITLRNPVEQVNWDDCVETLRRLDLLLPTEAQWEYGARAGTSTVWWTGDDKHSLEGAVDIADQSAARARAPWMEIQDWPELDDGYPLHAPVGSYRANAFGLHDVVGNVFEWCLDPQRSYELSPRPGDGFRDGPEVDVYNTRGGCFSRQASLGRSANRIGSGRFERDFYSGLRPARRVER